MATPNPPADSWADLAWPIGLVVFVVGIPVVWLLCGVPGWLWVLLPLIR